MAHGGHQLVVALLQALPFPKLAIEFQRREMKFELVRGNSRHDAQHGALALAELPWLGVDGAYAAQRQAGRGGQRCAGIKSDARTADDQRMIAEADVNMCIVDDEAILAENRETAEGERARRLPDLDSDASLEPLSLCIHEAHERRRHVEPERDQLGHPIECGLRRRVQNLVAAQFGQPFRLVDRYRSGGHAFFDPALDRASDPRRVTGHPGDV